MATGNYCGFVRWLFTGASQWPKSIYFWGVALMLLSLAAAAGGCPDPWPFRIYVTGIVLMLVQIVVWMVQIQYSRYQDSVDRTERELVRK